MACPALLCCAVLCRAVLCCDWTPEKSQHVPCNPQKHQSLLLGISLLFMTLHLCSNNLESVDTTTELNLRTCMRHRSTPYYIT